MTKPLMIDARQRDIEIEALRAENAHLRAALEEIAEMTKPEVRTGAKARPYAEQNIHFRARAALTAQPAEGEK